MVFADDTVGPSAAAAVAGLERGGIVVLENLRFNAAETATSDTDRREFARRLAGFGDAFVSDGFGVVHRKQASVFELAELLPSAAGLLVETELDVLERLTERPERPYTVVLGGSKVSDKLGVIDALLPKVDSLLIGGGMLFTFLVALGHRVGSSLLEEDQVETVARLPRTGEGPRGRDRAADRHRRGLVVRCRRRDAGDTGRSASSRPPSAPRASASTSARTPQRPSPR